MEFVYPNLTLGIRPCIISSELSLHKKWTNKKVRKFRTDHKSTKNDECSQYPKEAVMDENIKYQYQISILINIGLTHFMGWHYIGPFKDI